MAAMSSMSQHSTFAGANGLHWGLPGYWLLGMQELKSDATIPRGSALDS